MPKQSQSNIRGNGDHLTEILKATLQPSAIPVRGFHYHFMHYLLLTVIIGLPIRTPIKIIEDK